MDNGIFHPPACQSSYDHVGKTGNLQWSKVLVEFYVNDMKIVIAALHSVLLRCVTVCYPSTEQLKCSNYKVIPLNAYLEENEKIHLYHHCQTHLIITLISTRFHY